MGFQRGALLLTWDEGTEFHGLEVRMKRMSIRQLTEIVRLADMQKSDNADEIKSAWAELLDAVGRGLLSWNYEDDNGTAIPATREALDDVDVDMILQLVRAWQKAVAGVPLASSPSSTTGEPVAPPEELAWLAYEQKSPESLPELVSS